MKKKRFRDREPLLMRQKNTAYVISRISPRINVVEKLTLKWRIIITLIISDTRNSGIHKKSG